MPQNPSSFIIDYFNLEAEEMIEEMTTIVGVGTDKLLYTRSTLTSEWENIPDSGSMIAIAVMPDGAIIGVGTDNLLYTRSTLTSEWENIPDSSSVIAIAVMPDETIIGVGTDNLLYTRSTLTSAWEKIPDSGSMIAIAVMPDETIIGVGTDNLLYKRSTLASEWEKIPDSGSVIAIAVMPDGAIIGVGTDNLLYKRSKLASEWEKIPDSGSVIGVAVLTKINSGEFIGQVQLLEKDFEQGERARLRFIFKNSTTHIYLKNIRVSSDNSDDLGSGIKIITKTITKPNLYPQETTDVILELESSDDTPVGQYTVLPNLQWDAEILGPSNREPLENQGVFKIVSP